MVVQGLRACNNGRSGGLRRLRESPLLTNRVHKYAIGQNVRYTSGPFGRFGATGSFKVVKLLPSDGDEHQYRIKSAGEAFERVAKESQLDREGS